MANKNAVNVIIRARDEASRKFIRIGKSATGMGTALKAAAAGVAVYFSARVIKNFMQSSVAGFAEFEDQLSMVSTMLDEQTMQYLPKYDKQLRMLAIRYGESTATLTKGLYDILSASIDPAKAMTVLAVSVKAAKAGMTDAGVAADAITTIINSYGLKAKDAAMVSDKLFAIVKRGKITFEELAPNIGKVSSLAAVAGLSFNEVGAAISTLTRAGLPAEIALTSVRAVINAFLKPAKESIKVARQYGFEMNSSTLKTLGLVGVIKKLKNASAEEMAMLIPNIRGMAGFAASVKQAEEQMHDLNLMMDSSGRTQEAFLKRTGKLKFVWAQLREGWIQSKNVLGRVLAPTILAISKKIRDMFLGFQVWAQDNETKLNQWGSKISTVVASVKNEFVDFVKYMKTDWKGTWDWVMTSFLDIMKAVFKDAVVLAFNGGRSIMASIKNGLGAKEGVINMSALQLFRQRGGQTQNITSWETRDKKWFDEHEMITGAGTLGMSKGYYINKKQKGLYEKVRQDAREAYTETQTEGLIQQLFAGVGNNLKAALLKTVNTRPWANANAGGNFQGRYGIFSSMLQRGLELAVANAKGTFGSDFNIDIAGGGKSKTDTSADVFGKKPGLVMREARFLTGQPGQRVDPVVRVAKNHLDVAKKQLAELKTTVNMLREIAKGEPLPTLHF